MSSTTSGLFALLFAAVGITIFSGLAQADDVQIIANVVGSSASPTATPVDFVKLPVGQDATSAPFVTIQIVGLEPYSFVQVFAQSEPILIASGFANKDGVFATKAQIPPSLASGAHSITASTQLKGETTASVKTLVKFTVAESGTIGAVKGSGGGSGGSTGGSTGGGKAGGGASGGGSSGGGSTPTPTSSGGSVIVAQGESYGGILVVGGFKVSSQPTWSPNGSVAKLSVTLENSYSKPYSLQASFRVINFLGVELARSKKVTVPNLKSKETKTIDLETLSKIGQWGAYSAEISIYPPKKIDSYQLQKISRSNDFFVVPVIPGSILLGLLTLEVLRRIFWIRFVSPFQKRDLTSVSEGEE